MKSHFQLPAPASVPVVRAISFSLDDHGIHVDVNFDDESTAVDLIELSDDVENHVRKALRLSSNVNVFVEFDAVPVAA